MIVGVPKETKDSEHRVALTPLAVAEIKMRGHTIIVERSAGVGAGASDEAYERAGASVVESAADVFEQADLIVKVKEPIAEERSLIRPDQILVAYLHLASDAALTEALIGSGAVCVAYETVTGPDGGLPLLAPMSAIAGRLSVQAGAVSMESVSGGAGVLMGGVPGVSSAKVVVIGGGVVGENAAAIAIGMGADVTVLDRDIAVLDRLDKRFGNSVSTVHSTASSIKSQVLKSDLAIGAVLLRGSRAPILVGEDLVKEMRIGSAIVDVAIDQGGCFGTSTPTTHPEPRYTIHGVVHYSVTNMPGAVPRTATAALVGVTLPFVIKIADHGVDALKYDANLLRGLNIARGHVTQQSVATEFGLEFVEPERALN